MYFPTLKPPKTTESVIKAFGGIDTTPSCPENCFRDMKNTSSCSFPLLSTRPKRLRLSEFSTPPTALHTVNGITCTVGNSLYHNGVLQYDGLSTDTEKQLVSMGSAVIVFPDGYYINTLHVDKNGICDEKGSIVSDMTYGNNTTVSIFPCEKGLPMPVMSATPPDPAENTLWLDLNEQHPPLKKYFEKYSVWEVVTTDCCCIEIEEIDSYFTPGDSIEIRGLDFYINGTTTVLYTEKNRLILDCPYDNLSTFQISDSANCRIRALLPIMDYVCEHQNRLFGCRYGLDRNGNFVNEIYASRLGSPGVWRSFAGLSTDSYTASCGSEGPFTGVISHMGYVVFFKENKIHRLFGTKPSNYTLYEDSFPGVKLGSEKSLCLYNGTLYYHGKDGIYSYAGSTPTLLSQALGPITYQNAVGAVLKNKYYISLLTSSNEPVTYVYDIERNIWNKEDSSRYTHLSSFESNILGFKEDNGSYTAELVAGDEIPYYLSKFRLTAKKEANFDWYAETSDIGFFTDDAKTLTRLNLRLQLNWGSTLRIYIMTDSSGIWKSYGSFLGGKMKTFTMNVAPPRCDHLRLKFVGKGECKIYSLTKVFEYSGEVK